MVGALHHVTVVTREAPLVIDVLTRILGFPVLAEHEIELSDVSELFGWEEAPGQSAITILGNGHRGLVEIVQVGTATDPLEPTQPTVGITQLAVAVDNFERTLELLGEVRQAQIRGPVEVRLGGATATVASVTFCGVQVQMTAVS